MGHSSTPNPPKPVAPTPAPTAGESYADWIQSYSENADLRKTVELGDLETQMQMMRFQAPEIISMAEQYGPQYNQMMFDLERQMAPQYYDLNQAIRERQVADIATMAPGLRDAMSDPQTEAIRRQLGDQVATQLGYGANLDPQLAREVEQSVRAGQSARGMIRGNAPVTQEALMKGIQAEQLRQARQQAATQFLQTQATTQFDPWTAITGVHPTRQSASYQAPQTSFAPFSNTMVPMTQLTAQAGAQNAQMQNQFKNQANMLDYNYQNQLAAQQTNDDNWWSFPFNL